MCKVDKAATQRIHQECADLIPLARFVAGLTGVVETQADLSAATGYSSGGFPCIAVLDAEYKVKFNETFYKRFEN